MPNVKQQLIRLLGSVICSGVILYFAEWHSQIQIHFYDVTDNEFHVHSALSAAAMFFYENGQWIPVFPFLVLLPGILLLWKRPHWLATFEFFIFGLWISTVVIVGLCIIAWEYQFQGWECQALNNIRHGFK